MNIEHDTIAASDAKVGVVVAHYWTRTTLLFLGIAIAGAGGVWLGFQSLPGRYSPLAIAPEFLDFGEQWEQSDFKWTVAISNTSNGEVEVVDVPVSCHSCTSVEPRAFKIAPGGSAVVHLTLNLEAFNSTDSQGAPRYFEVEVMPLIQDGLIPQKAFLVHGVVRKALEVSTRELNWGGTEPLVEAGPHPGKTLVVLCIEPVKGLEADCDSPYVTLDVVEVGPKRYNLFITPKETLPLGPFEFHILLRGRVHSDKLVPPVIVYGSGLVVPDVHLTPSRLPLGIRQVGEIVNEIVVLSSHSGKPFVVEEAVVEATSGLEVRIEPIESSSTGNMAAYRVLVICTKAGQSKGDLRFLIQGTGEGLRSNVRMQLAAYGMASALLLNEESAGETIP